jgi:hypothetical protein
MDKIRKVFIGEDAFRSQLAPVRLGDSSGFNDRYKDDVLPSKNSVAQRYGIGDDQAHHVAGQLASGYYLTILGGIASRTVELGNSLNEGNSPNDLAMNKVIVPIGRNLRSFEITNTLSLGFFGYNTQKVGDDLANTIDKELCK